MWKIIFYFHQSKILGIMNNLRGINDSKSLWGIGIFLAFILGMCIFSKDTELTKYAIGTGSTVVVGFLTYRAGQSKNSGSNGNGSTSEKNGVK